MITRLSSDTLIPGLANLVVESAEEFADHALEFDRVRWLSAEIPPVYELMKNGISCDRRPITSRGDIEISRWFWSKVSQLPNIVMEIQMLGQNQSVLD